MNKLLLFFVAVSMFLSFSCSKDEVKTKGKVKITFDFKKFKKAIFKANATKASLTLKKGNSAFMTRKVVDVKENSGAYSIELELDNANYSIEELVLGGDDLVPSSDGSGYPKYTGHHYFTPKKTDAQSTAVDKPLPVNFTVSGGNFSAAVSLVVINTDDATAPTVPGVTGSATIRWSDVITYGFKTLEVGGSKLTDVVIKADKTLGGSFAGIEFYGISTLKTSGYPYLVLAKASSGWDFELSKFGYKSKKAARLTIDGATQSSMVKVYLEKLAGVANDVYVKNVTTSGSDDDKLQRGGADFGSKAYWDHLAVKASGNDLFNIDEGATASPVPSGMTRITSEYELPAGDYDVTFKLYSKTGVTVTNAVFNIGISDKKIYYKQGGSGSGVGNSVAPLALPVGTHTTAAITKSVTGAAKGKVHFEVTTASKSNIYFSIEEIKKK